MSKFNEWSIHPNANNNAAVRSTKTAPVFNFLTCFNERCKCGDVDPRAMATSPSSTK